MPWFPTKAPRSRKHADFAGPVNGVVYIAFVDSHSKWLKVMSMPSTNTETTISPFDSISTTECMGLQKFERRTMENRSVCHSSKKIANSRMLSYHLQSYDQAEHFVDTFKRAPLKSKVEEATKGVIQKFLLTYRTTPHQMLGCKTPAELLMGKKVQTINYIMIQEEKT